MKLPLALSIVLFGLVLGLFSPALHNGFTGYDDDEYVVDNSHVRTGITPENVSWAFTAAHSNNWHPLTWVSHQLDASIFGVDPAGHHFTSVLLHAMNTVLLFLWLYGLTGRVWPAAFVALGFGVHPLHVESVAWVAERKDVLSTFFGMLTLLAYTTYVRRPGRARFVAVAAALTAGLMAKQMLVSVPAILLLLDWFPLKRPEPLRRLILEKAPLFALSALSCVAALWAQRRGGALAAIDHLPLGLRLSNAALSCVRYLVKTVWPADLSVFYPFPVNGIALWKVAGAAFAIIAISALAWRARRDHPWLALGWAWYLITLMPVIGIVQVGMQAMADRYMYAPMIGVLMAVAFEAAEGPRAIAYAGVALLAAWSAVTWRQIPVWHDGVTLFTHALEIDRENFVAHDNLGVELDRRGQHEAALAHYRETLRLKPGDRNGESNYAQASFAKGQRLLGAGDPAGAIAAFRDGLHYRPGNALALLSLGVAQAQTGHDDAAREAFEAALRYDPRNVEAHFDLGLVYNALGRRLDAVHEFRSALEWNPSYTPARDALAQLETVTGSRR